ncbi:iron uptake transporter deferrochelatase/peroxidase subunit [Pseudonocardia spinosispora]|uniref:iron uptake transporter deferrochelatase/peroxidase subunit n=1 Tax=Pseudonocardia spinosispora TaxID=103441 RepID=UPI00041E896C|nr:iron uptake transporter deferrochelatase/peroxidase subunit [Pseudonocardia spinosispora]
MTEQHDVRPAPGALSRRRVFGLTGAGVALAGAATLSGCAPEGAPAAVADVVPFRGPRQAGIVTPAQDRLHFVALDVITSDRHALRDLLMRWTLAAERMTTGRETAPNGATGLGPLAPPSDTGEALGLPASQLTLTFGVGRGLFEKDGVDRFGLRDKMPPGLAPLPGFQQDNLDPTRSDGDLCIQACSNDPQVAVHAIRNLVRMGFGTTEVRWSQLGFGRTSSTSTSQATPRNLFGFKDGTNNLKAEQGPELDTHVWVAAGDGPDWLTGGSYLVARRISMHIEVWDRTSLAEQEDLIGRTKGEGAPLSGKAEFDLADLAAKGPDGKPLIAPDAHIRLASAEALGGVRILRRGYNFVDGSDGRGHLNAGLFFIAFVRDPHKQFVPMQRALSGQDRMMEYVQHTGSALFACPPGLAPDGHWATNLL